MARLDPYLPLIAEGVWEQHQHCARRQWFDGHALINWLNERHNGALNGIYALYGTAIDPQMTGDQQIGKSLYKLGQWKIGTVASGRQIDTPHGDRDGSCDVSTWEISPRTRQALERWMAQHCPERLARLTGSAWSLSSDPSWMLAHLSSLPENRPGRPTPRKLRLFACAAVRSAWGCVPDERCRHAVEVAERFADGLAGVAELAAAREAAMRAWQVAADPAKALVRAAHNAAASDAALAAQDAAAEMRRRAATAARLQCDLLRELFGPTPSRPQAVDPAWLAWEGGIVHGLAAAAYEARLPDGRLDPARLIVLGDALLDAGCTRTELTDHLRGPGPHARGCFVLDLLLGMR
jgi:hypothetical protein